MEQRLISGAATGRTAGITVINHDSRHLTMYGTESGPSGVTWNLSIAEA